MKPKRIRRKRTKGFKMPPNTIYVGRGSKWGNPFMVGMYSGGEPIDRDEAVRLYRQHIRINHLESEITQLRGKNLACWCPLDKPCHADVLLELANV